MRQLKYFTVDKDVVKAVCAAVEASGLPEASVKVFQKDNSDHRFDGLLLNRTHDCERSWRRQSATLFIALALFGAAAISAGVIDFTLFALMGVLAYVLTSVMAESGNPKHAVTGDALANADKGVSSAKNNDKHRVYFIVVSVGHHATRVAKQLSRYDGLAPQS